MREILFRGKARYGGYWTDGVYINDCYILPNTDLSRISVGGMILNEVIEVVPETIGQYTGLKDCNGKMIFEGDVVKVRGSKKVGEYTTTVVFKRNCFMLDDNKTIFIDNMSLIGVEIIGNIHDQKEDV